MFPQPRISEWGEEPPLPSVGHPLDPWGSLADAKPQHYFDSKWAREIDNRLRVFPPKRRRRQPSSTGEGAAHSTKHQANVQPEEVIAQASTQTVRSRKRRRTEPSAEDCQLQTAIVTPSVSAKAHRLPSAATAFQIPGQELEGVSLPLSSVPGRPTNEDDAAIALKADDSLQINTTHSSMKLAIPPTEASPMRSLCPHPLDVAQGTSPESNATQLSHKRSYALQVQQYLPPFTSDRPSQGDSKPDRRELREDPASVPDMSREP